ncbi:nrps5 single domain, non-ribosomal peptide synthase-like protein [Fusarium sp. DS 682]|nr:nrps5 single domain, non-ribosomal peptide synthase-like protein [Fusarium sp. DS 682]
MTLNILDFNKTIELHFTYWTDKLSDSYASGVVEATLRAVEAIAQDPSRKMPVIDLLSDSSRQRIMDWNSQRHSPIQSTVHALIEAHVKEIPDNCAVASWEGELSYIELDRYATRLALYLRSLGVGPEVTVPLCFKKSIWTVVAMLAVMKAGGIFVPLDHAHPPDRIQMIVEQLPSRIVALTSPECVQTVSYLVDNTISVDAASLAQLENPGSANFSLSPAATPSNGVYIIFTSGSTGQPKGVLLEHTAVATGTTAHGHHMSYSRDSRVLQFSSYAFDACIMEIITTLVYGGCICILSEEERMNDLVGAINRLRVNWVFLTPAVANMLEPSAVPTIRLIALGGEPLGHAVVRKWDTDTCQVVQVYGPTECCAICTHDYRRGFDPRPEIIGTAMGCNTWVVDPRDPNILMPIGAVGELLIQGPILARGYLNDPGKTRDAFLSDLSWLPNGRLYRTGDMVSYCSEGKGNKIAFVRRKDTQVKVRGQRIELGEISYQIGAAHSKIATQLVVLGARGKFAGKIVAILAFHGLPTERGNDNEPMRLLDNPKDLLEARAIISEIHEFISDRLPSYMQPFAMIAVNRMPLNSSGKLETRRVAAWVDGLKDETYDRIMNFVNEPEPDPEPEASSLQKSEAEEIIRGVIAEVVNLPLEQVPLRRSFFSLGGDSISAMAVVSRCRSRGIELTVQDIFNRKTITALAEFASRATEPTAVSAQDGVDRSEEIDVNFPLSPIQQMFFDIYPDGINYFNQSFLVQIPATEDLTSQLVHDALRQLVDRHSMLRARFSDSEGDWVQRVTAAGDAKFLNYQDYNGVAVDEAANLIDIVQKSLDIRSGPVIAASLMHLTDNRRILALVAHHLVVDMVSWRVLLEELEIILSGKAHALQDVIAPVPFQAWVRTQPRRVQRWSPSRVLPYDIPKPRMDYWGSNVEEANPCGSTREVSFTLGADMTKALLGPCNEPLQTDPQDLFLAAAFQSFAEAFPDRGLPAIFVEGHGRGDGATDGLDLSRTIGWFTSIVPIALADGVVAPGVIDTLMKIKDARRSVPGQGVPYFSYRYLSAAGVRKFRNHDKMEILFNYFGQYQQLERDGALLRPVAEDEFARCDVDASVRRLAIFDVAVAVAAGQATVTITMPGALAKARADGVCVWIDRLQHHITSLVHVTRDMTPAFTLNDMPLIKDMSYADLSDMRDVCLEHTGLWGPAAIEEIFPCSPMQQGILLSQAHKPDLYDVRVALEVSSRDGPIQAHNLAEAWRQVVQRQPMLRTVFLPNLRGSGSFDQAVLRDPTPAVRHIDLDDGTVVLPRDDEAALARVKRAMAEAHGDIFRYGKLPHEFITYTVESRVFVLIRLSHALVDGSSLPIVLHDLREAYAHRLSTKPGLGYRELVSFIHQQPADQAVGYWADFLKDATPCRLPPLLDDVNVPSPAELEAIEVVVPHSESLRSLCAAHGITMASIFHTAWALVLRAYTGEDEVLFGYLTSGRDAPIDGVTTLVGPLINMLTCRVIFDDRSKSVLQLLRQLQDDFIEGISNQHVSLAEVQHRLGIGSEGLFTSIVSFQRHDAAGGAANDDGGLLKMTPIDGRDPTEYDLSVNVLDEAGEDIQIHFTYWTSKASPSHAMHMMRALLAAVAGISGNPDQPLVKVDLVGAETRRDMDAWNVAGIPFTSDECIHHLIERQAHTIPERQAVCGWDRTFTYRELDEAANAFAHYMRSLLDFKPDTFVVTCFDKSAWVIVSQLAILKAGGAFVAIDSAYPADRVEAIVSDLGSPPILLTESKYKDRFKDLFPHIAIVNEEGLSSLGLAKNPPSTCIRRNHAAYAIFTSGSTGRPKGIVIEHGSLSTAALLHAGPYQITRNTRALQFAAYTFDVSIGETFYPLAQGGCVCVPSEGGRLEDLPGAINSLNADWAFLTPTVADILDPVNVPDLKTLVLGGEAPTADNIRRWHDKVFLIIGYGPAETTIWCNATGRLKEYSDPANFGPPMGARVWVTDADDPSMLLPVGAVGEIIIEGPLVGRGYTDPDKTSAAFISPPEWMTSPYPGKCIYRSGDIVRSRPDGTYSFVRRRDNQVKVRGQRVELNEVEVHISQAETGIRHAVVLYPRTGACQGRLTAVLSHHSPGGEGQGRKQTSPGSGSITAVRNDEAATTNDMIQNRLLSSLPPYMVPKIWITVEQLPFTKNGKMDRRQISAWLESLTEDVLASIVERGSSTAGAVESPRRAKTLMEEHLFQIWASALNLPVDSIPQGQSFTSLGGDSITAMQVLSRARDRGITITVHDILRSRSIPDLASRARFKTMAANGADDSKILTTITDEPFSLLPIQRMFFKRQPSGNHHFNQSFIVRLTRIFTAEQVRTAITAIVKHHPMLRARFLHNDDEWKQKISSDITGSFNFQHRRSSNLVDSIDTLDELQTSLDINQGPLLTSCLLDLSDGQALFLAAHHLVVDLVSWRVILADLEQLLEASPGASPLSLERETVSMPAWAEALIRQATEYHIDSVLPFTVPAADFSFWDMDSGKGTNIMADAISLQARIDITSTAALLGPANAAFGTDPGDLMIAALIFSFRSIFPERSSIPTIYTESHGRNAWDDDIDLSRTVGWFTTIYPIAVPEWNTVERDLLWTVRQVKDIRRRIPGKGFPYFTYRYLTEEGRAAFEHHEEMEILFNYLGQYQQLQKSDTVIQQIGETALSTRDIADSTPRMALIDVMAAIEGSELVLSFGYNTKMRLQHRFQAWLDGFHAALETLSSQLPTIPATFTPGDFPLLALGEDGLLTLAAASKAKVGSWGPDIVEAAYPCSPLQQGILLSQAKDAAAYVVQGIWKISPAPGGASIDRGRLHAAWRRLVEYHPVLRTVFCESGRNDGIYAQVVLRETATAAQPTIDIQNYDGPDPLAFLRSSTPALPSDKPPYALLVCDTGNDIYLSFRISHALIDGTSMGLLMNDLLRAYDGMLEGVGPSYEPYIAHVYNKPVSQSLSYWSDTLAAARPCHFPVLVEEGVDVSVRSLNKITRLVPDVEAMRQLGRTHGVSVANFFQVAWALVLRAFTGSDDVCFGYLTSGRDVPVDRIDEIVGPLISMLISSTNFSIGDDAPSALELLQTMNRNYIDSLPHQHSALADIQRALHIGNKGLFNTVMSLQKVTMGEEIPGQLELDVVEGHDPSEYNITLNIVDYGETIELHFTYWSDKLSDSHASDVVEATLRALDAIIQDPNRTLPVVDMLGDSGRRQIMEWNSDGQPQPAIDSTVHALIEAHVKESPNRSAVVSSWEGELSYAELDSHAARLSVYLRSLGVGPEVTVPLIFSKSIWMVVAMLAVMKAGGVFVPLDPAHPPERIAIIVEQLPNRTVALASPDRIGFISSLVDNAVALDAGVAASLTEDNGGDNELPLDSATPDNAVYIIFTSGSTGQPKGVVLDHRATATGTTAHGRAIYFSKDVRTLQFSSYAFDACITEIITTLVYGGCVCVLSEDERINDLAAAINRLQATWMLLTPAVASTLDPSEVPCIRYIALGGESSSHATNKKWSKGGCRVLHAYGPTECCVMCTYDDRTGLPTRPEVIGGAVGCNTWVVDPRDPSVLMPIGAVGELLVQGPIMARGYLNNSDKTQEAFLDTGLPWLSRLSRAYRTGDLVSYCSEGKGNKLTFVRRKDTQVKVRGQRIELGEISYQISASHDKIATQMVMLGSRGTLNGKIVAILTLRGLHTTDDDGRDSEPLQILDNPKDIQLAKDIVSEVQNYIADKLPAYMHPSVIIVVNRMPINSSGKLETRRVAQWIDEVTDEMYERITRNLADAEPEAGLESAHGPVEQIISEAVAEVINLPGQVSLRRSFISMGGDSITAMQVMALCRRRGISLPVQDILKSANIIAMAAKAQQLRDSSVDSPNNADLGDELAPFPLSPIQKLHLTQFPDGENHYNQSMLLELRRPTSDSVLHSALLELVRRHPMLRARLEKGSTGGQWTQRVTNDIQGSLSYAAAEMDTWEEAQDIMIEAERGLDITAGPLMAARLVRVHDSTSIFLVAHHLVIDLVSWRILLRDLEQLIAGTSLPGTQMSWSYQRWVNSLEKYAETNASTALALQFTPSESDLDFWGIDATSNDFTNLAYGDFTLDPSLTSALLHAAHKSLKAEVLDVLLAMAAHTFSIVFSDRAAPTFHTETHGRDHPQDTTASVHETVGWFTAIVPLVLDAPSDDYIESVIRVKDIRRAIPGLGVPYFTAKTLQGSQTLPVEILFNYLGRFQQLERDDGLFESLPKSMGPVDVNLSAARLSVVDISAVMEKDALTVSWNYNTQIQHQDRLSKWFALYEQALSEVASALQKTSLQLTKSDVPLLPISHQQLKPLNEALAAVSRNGVEGVEDVYPTSPMQRGILLSQSKDASQYDVHAVWEITPSKGNDSQVDVSRLQRAWHRVIQRHPMLRTVFIGSLLDDTAFDQVVLKKFRPSIKSLTYDDDDDHDSAMEELWESASGSFELNTPAHRLAICAGPQGKVYAHFQVSHALIDATSLQTIIRDWALAYANPNLPVVPGTPYSTYIAHIQKTSLDASLRFWADQLEGAAACRLPRLTDGRVPTGQRELRHLHSDVHLGTRLKALAKQLNISMASIFQLAWAMVLRSYTNLQDICFGYISSGRDVELDGISDAVGPFINILVSRIVFGKEDTAAAMLEQLFGTYLDSLPHQHASLADIKHALKMPSGQLFNTVLSFQKISQSHGSAKAQELPLSFNSIRGADPTEACIPSKPSEAVEADTRQFDVTLTVLEFDSSIEFSIQHWTSFLSESQANNLSQSLLQALDAIEATPSDAVDTLHLVPKEHMDQLKSWGHRLPPTVSRRVHDLFDDMVRSTPTAPAIHAWDGDFTYAELDRASSRLAGLLLQQGVKPDTFVAIVFEKSAWVAVAFLAILKAGAAFMLLDPEAPIERIQYMMEQTKTSVVLCSPTYKDMVDDWDAAAIVVSKELMATRPDFAGPFPDIPSSSAAYIIFTSGTTGKPKGAIIEHGSYCSSAVAQMKALYIGPGSRFLQFASFMFDATMIEMVTPLLAGGCVCIPRRQDIISDLPRVVRKMDINMAILTSSFIRTMSPEEVPTLKRLIQGGEPLSQKDVDIWADKVQLGNAYGPSECSVMASCLSDVTRTSEPSNIGYSAACAHWVTEPANMHRLVPIGAIGELLLEGPTLSRGYINNPAKTAEAFVSGLDWAPQMGRTPETRFYATGDLVRLNSDGSVTFVGRKDTQIKIHGQRMELGEIQHHLTTIDEIRHSIVLSPSEGLLRKRLVAVLELRDVSSTTASPQDIRLIAPSLRPKANESIQRIRDILTQRLPSYMIPSTWVVVRSMPTMISGKLNLPAVQSWVQNINDETYQEIHAAEAVGELDPSDKIAMQVSRKLSSLLTNAPGGTGNPEDFVGKDIVPMQCGLDSITAIALSTWLRKTFGVAISLATLLSLETSIQTLAALIKEEKAKTEPSSLPKVESVTASAPTAKAAIDLHAEFQHFDQALSQLPVSDIPNHGAAQTPSNFLVTGATGFLGSQIVRQLLFRPEVKRVFCLVRAEDDTQAQERMMDVARKGQWWHPDLSNRIEAWTGDLGKPHLGLDDTRWASVVDGAIDAIIHNGAVVHWHLSYRDLKDANVGSTFDLLSALSKAPSPPRFVYVTGGYFSDGNKTDDEVLDLLQDGDGYSQTKFLSEMLVRSHGQRLRRHSAKFTTPVVIQPGLIIGDADHGVSNLDDFLWRVVASAIRVGAYNVDESNDPSAWMLVAGSDQIATSAVDACMLPASASASIPPSVRFVDGVPVKELWKILIDELGFNLRPMCGQDWLQALEDNMDSQGPSHPLFPVFDFLQLKQGTIGTPKIMVDAPICPQEETLHRLRRSLEYLNKIGFFALSGPGQPDATISKAAFRRTGLRPAKTAFF